MGLKEYEVTVDGRHPHTTTLLLSDEDAKRAGLIPDEKAATPENKAAAPQNKADAPHANKKLFGRK